MLFLNLKIAGRGRYHECMKMLVSSVCLLSRQIILCQNGLSFLWQKETIFIYFMVITFAVYEREQNWPPQTTRH